MLFIPLLLVVKMSAKGIIVKLLLKIIIIVIQLTVMRTNEDTEKMIVFFS